MHKVLVFLFVITIALGLSSCNLFNNDDDPEVYTGGSITQVTFMVASPHSVTLNWLEDFPDEDGFYIDRQSWDDVWQPWERKIIEVGADIHTAIDTSAVMGTSYRYKVYAFKGDSESEESPWDYNFWLPHPLNPDFDFSWANPTRIRFFWTNQATWADSIVVGKQLDGQDWVPRYTVLPGAATEYTDTSYNVTATATWGFTAYYQDHVSQQATITMLAP